MQVTGYLRLDVRIHHPVQRPDPFVINRNVPLLHSHHFHFRSRRRAGGLRPLGASGRNEQRSDQNAQG